MLFKGDEAGEAILNEADFLVLFGTLSWMIYASFKNLMNLLLFNF